MPQVTSTLSGLWPVQLKPFASFPHVPSLPQCSRPPWAPHARKP